MRRILIIAVLLIAAVMVVTPTARAQWGDDNYYDTAAEGPRWGIHAGAAFLTGDTEDDTTYIAGVHYESPLGGYEGESTAFLTFDVSAIPIDTLTTGNEVVVPLLIGYKKYGRLASTRAYAELAAGARWSTDEIPELRIENDFSFAWAVRVGADLSDGIFAQVGYLAGKHPGDDAAWTIELGAKF